MSNIIPQVKGQQQVPLVCPVSRPIKPPDKLNSKAVIRIRNDVVKAIEPKEDEKACAAIMTKYNPAITESNIRGYRIDKAVRWVSDVLQFEVFYPGETIFIEADTGKGKTTFIEKCIVPYNKRVLYVTNRISNRSQFEIRLRYCLNVSVMSYQAMEQDIYIDGSYLDEFDVVIFDEIHYLHSDGSFSNSCGITLRKILESNKAIKIFMSATIEYAAEYLINSMVKAKGNQVLSSIRWYRFERDCPNYTSVSEVDKDFIIPIIKHSDYKWIIFVESTKSGMEYLEKLGEDAVFVSRPRIEAGGEPREVYEKLIEDEIFDKKVLITTAVLDSGVNIKDKNLRGIVLDVDNRIQLVQMVGRKRFVDKEDSADIYIIHRDMQELYMKSLRMKQMIDEFTDAHNHFHTCYFPKQCIAEDSEEGRRYRRMIYNDEQKKKFSCNYLGKFDLAKRRGELIQLINSENSFAEKCRWLFGEEYSKIPIGTTMQEIRQDRMQELNEFLAGYIGKTFKKLGDEANEFRTEFSKFFWKRFGINKEDNQRVDRPLSFNKISEILLDFHIPVNIEQKYIKKVSYIEIKDIDASINEEGGALNEAS